MDQIIYRCGDCQVDGANRRFTRSGREIALEPKVFAVVLELVMRPGALVTRDQLLDAVWGHRFVTPSTLNRVIALARRAFADDADGQRFIQTVHGAGYRYVGPVEKAVSMPAEPRARFGPPPSARLPARLQALIGREQELEQIEDLVGAGRALTILGTGGMGKTQCALAFAHAHADRYPDGVWFFDLAPMQQADEWLQTLALALSIAPTSAAELLQKVTQSLADRSALLVLDNCDRVAAGVGTLIVRILQATERIKVLATSQQQLNFVGERVLRMPPLRLPEVSHPSDAAELRAVAATPAVSLLLARVRDAQPEFALTAANAPAVVGICERLDGMPLALELAAARFALLSPDQVLERLDRRFRFLVSDVAGRDRRHQNLITLLDWSFKLLSSEEQRLLAWLGVFVQGWTVDAVMHLASAFGGTPETIVDLLIGLANKSLVAVDQSVSPPRYRLLESVREFALEQLAALGEVRRARDAHLADVLRMAEAAHKDMLGGRMRERIALLVRENGNIESACEYAVGAGDKPQAALQIAGLLMFYFKAHGAISLGLRLGERALGASGPSRTRERGRALMCLGVVGVMIKRVAPDAALTEALAIARETGDRWTEAYASANYAMWCAHVGRAYLCGEYIATVQRVAVELGDPLLLGAAGLARGWWHLAVDAVDEAIRDLRAVRRLGDDFHQHHFIDMYIGLGLFRRGDDAGAAAEFHEAMRNALAVGHTRGVAGSIEGCGYIAARNGRLEEACRCLGAADRIRRQTEIPLFSFWERHNESANAALRSALGVGRYVAAVTAGSRMRQEDVVNEAAALLREFAANL